MVVVSIMGRLQVNTGGAGIGPLLSVFLYGKRLPTTLLLEGGRVAGEALMNLSGSFPNP